MLQFLLVTPLQTSPASWGSIRAFYLVMRNFEHPASVNLFLYLFDVVRNPSRYSRTMRQGFIDFTPSSSENLFSPFMIDSFAGRFVLVRPHNLVSLRKIGSVDDFGELTMPFFRGNSLDVLGTEVLTFYCSF